MSDRVLLNRQLPLATVTINQPDRRNVISFDMWRELDLMLSELEADRDIRAVIITGTGDKAFSAGADIRDFQDHRFGVQEGSVYNEGINGLLSTLHGMGTPTISMIHGYAVGGGCELALATDLRIAAEGSRFGIPVARLGISAGHLEMRDLVNLVGKGNALYILLSGRLIEDQEALRMGLINQLVPKEELETYTYRLAEEIGSLAPLSHSVNKITLNQVLDKPSLGDLTPEEAALPLAQFDTRDYQEGYTAFLEKRRPRFIGE
jgi:enoyl-CoA hydratase/carnithine racemase